MIKENRYLAAETVPDIWICYPWEATYEQILTYLAAVTDFWY